MSDDTPDAHASTHHANVIAKLASEAARMRIRAENLRADIAYLALEEDKQANRTEADTLEAQARDCDGAIEALRA